MKYGTQCCRFYNYIHVVFTNFWLEVSALVFCVVDIADEKMDDKTPGSSKVDAVLHRVTFYSKSNCHNVPNVQMKAAVHTGCGLGSHSVSDHKMQKSERCIDGSKSKVVERRVKSIESVRLTKSKYRLVRKPKHTLLPYKRGQLRLYANAESVIVRNRSPVTVNSEVAIEKENKICSDNCSANGVTEKLNTRAGTSRRFFKASFSKRRQFTLNMHGLTTGPTKVNYLKRHERNTVLRNKQLCLNATSVSFKPHNEQITEKCCENDPAVCSVVATYESLCEDAVYKNTDVAVESAEANVESDSTNQAVSNADCAVTNESNIVADEEKCTSDTVDHSTESLDLSASLYSDSAASSPSMKQGICLCSLCIVLCTHTAVVIHVGISSA